MSVCSVLAAGAAARPRDAPQRGGAAAAGLAVPGAGLPLRAAGLHQPPFVAQRLRRARRRRRRLGGRPPEAGPPGQRRRGARAAAADAAAAARAGERSPVHAPAGQGGVPLAAHTRRPPPARRQQDGPSRQQGHQPGQAL